jgi:hypothetical protein
VALIKCPDCGRDVSDLAPACLGCGRPIAGAVSKPHPAQPANVQQSPTSQLPAAQPTSPPPPTASTLVPAFGGVLRSNIGDVDKIEPVKKMQGFPTGAMLIGVFVIVVVVAVALLLTANRGGPPQATSPGTSAASAARPPLTAVPIAAATSRRASGAATPLPDVNSISCDTLESTIFHIHLHLAIFVDGQEQMLPLGIGIGQPWQVEDSAEGPFVTDGSCFYWIHTHTEDGVVHIESPIRRRFTLGDFFAIWQVPLSATQVGPAQGQVITYVNGSRDDRNPADIPLLSHERIQLDIGGDVPPYVFDFPPGD